jgi:3-hydroxy acid dehydrogenase / malonic semialdehyde reductase
LIIHLLKFIWEIIMENQYKVAVITGASAGIGEAIALQFGKKGIKLILVARRKEKLLAVAEKLKSNTKCHIIACDIRDKETIKKAFSNLPKEFSEVDILVNNAGLALGLGPAHRASWDDWEQMIDTNVTALAYLTHLLLPGMVARNSGHIVNIGSVAGSYAYPGGNVYGASKAFVEHFSRNVKADLVGTNVRVTNIEPGLVGNSEFSLTRFKGDIEKAAKVYSGANPLLPGSIADCITWAVTRPKNVNICRIEVMPVSQGAGPLAVYRGEPGKK